MLPFLEILVNSIFHLIYQYQITNIYLINIVSQQ